MASLAASLAAQTDSLAERSTQGDLIGPAVEPGESHASVREREPSPAGRSTGLKLAATQRKPATDDDADAASTDTATLLRSQPTKLSAAVAPPVTVDAANTQEEVLRPVAGREGRLEASGERVVKWTLELPPQLIMALNVWERDETKRLGRRVFRERVIDLALSTVPEDLPEILQLVSALPAALRDAGAEQFGTRVRESVRARLLGLRPELRVAGIKDIRTRDVYSAAVYRYLQQLGVPIEEG